jgi:hypothetical protein
MSRPTAGGHRLPRLPGVPDRSGASGINQPVDRGYAAVGMGPGAGIQQKALQAVKTAVGFQLKAITDLGNAKSNDQVNNARNMLDSNVKNMAGGAKAIQKDSPAGKKYAKVLAAHKALTKKLDTVGIAKASAEVKDLKKQLTELQALLP